MGDVWRATTTSPVPIVGSMLPDITVRLFAWNALGRPTASTSPAERPEDDPRQEEEASADDAPHWFCASHVKPTMPVSPWAATSFCTCSVNR